MIRELKPVNIFLASWILWLFFFAISPWTYTEIRPLFPATIIFILYNLFFFIGLKTNLSNTASRSKKNISGRVITTLILITFLLGLVGIALRVYQRISLGLTLNIIKNRDLTLAAGEGQGGIISIFAAMFYPFSFIALMLAILFRKHLNSLQVTTIVLLGIYPILDNILLGGRSAFFFQGITLVFLFQLKKEISPKKGSLKTNEYFILRIFRKIRIYFFNNAWVKWRRLLFLTIAGICSLSFFIAINSLKSISTDDFAWRKIIDFSEEYRMLEYDPEFKTLLLNNPGNSGLIGLATVNHYIIHGVFEFHRWVNYTNSFWGLYFGKFQFYVFVKFFKLFGIDTGKDFLEMTQSAGRSGIYTTFWGPVFLDFGIFGIPYAFALGFLFNSAYRSAVNNHSLLGILSYPFIASTIFSISIINAVVGQNMYFLPAIFLTYLLYLTIKTSYQE